MLSGDNLVKTRVPRMKKVELKDKAGKKHVCHGRFSMTEPYWEVMVKLNKNRYLQSAPIYSLRSDMDTVRAANMVTIFLSDCLQVCKNDNIQNGTQACFEQYCRSLGLKDGLTFTELSKVLTGYVRQEKYRGCFLGHSSNRGFGNLSIEDHSQYITIFVFRSDLGASVLAAVSFPQLVRCVSSLFRYSFPRILNKLSQNKMKRDEEREDNDSEEEMNKVDNWNRRLQQAEAMAQSSPWEFCFRDIVIRKIKLFGVEASLKAYQDAGYLPLTPVTQKDALFIYEVMKVDAKKHGHVYMPFRLLRDCQIFSKLGYRINGLERWKSALEYLETNGVTKTEEFGGDSNIFLSRNWQAEVDTTEAVKTILNRHKAKPFVWDVDLFRIDQLYKPTTQAYHLSFSPEFNNLRSDCDQLRACLLICSSPIVVMSGRGGCGKTTVITSLLKHLINRSNTRTLRSSRLFSVFVVYG
ncbi:DNA helicase B [Elysia marginata]|uniref:DNA helicase B n=1 Tax=Elysia marginata TaxID=1093978 RepID=A0AAV4HF67_9GAST|nr:DNA helicase B [Elysia marginata]